MAIKSFIFILFIVGSILLKISSSTNHNQLLNNKAEKPMVTFIDSTAYSINSTNIEKVIQSKKAMHYKSYDELFNATIINRGKNTKSPTTDTISAKYMHRNINNQTINLQGDVILNQNNYILLKTSSLLYNTKTQIGQTNKKFQLNYDKSIVFGDKLYFDGINDIIKANHIKAKIKIEEQQR